MTATEFRKRGREEIMLISKAFEALADELEWAEDAADSQTVGDGAKARSYASRPTENIAISGYPEGEEQAVAGGRPVLPDGRARGKAILRLQREETLKSIVGLQNSLKGRTSTLRKTMERLKPRGPLFEPPVKGGKGSRFVSDADMAFTREAQKRRQERREDPPLICSCKVLENGTLNRTALGNCAVHGPEPSGRRTA